VAQFPPPTPHPKRMYKLLEKVWSLHNRVDVLDQFGVPCFSMAARFLSGKFSVCDVFGTPRWSVEKCWRMGNAALITSPASGKVFAVIERTTIFGFFHDNYRLELLDGRFWTIKGSAWRFRYEVFDEVGQLVGTFREWRGWTLSNQYFVDVEANRDDALVLSIAAAVRMLRRHRRQEAELRSSADYRHQDDMCLDLFLTFLKHRRNINTCVCKS